MDLPSHLKELKKQTKKNRQNIYQSFQDVGY